MDTTKTRQTINEPRQVKYFSLYLAREFNTEVIELLAGYILKTELYMLFQGRPRVHSGLCPCPVRKETSDHLSLTLTTWQIRPQL